MGLFRKKKKEVKEDDVILDEKVPELPALPELPSLAESYKSDSLTPLPALPQSQQGSFDNEIVKAVISGEKNVKPRTREISARELSRKSMLDRTTRELPTKFREEVTGEEVRPPMRSFEIPFFVPPLRKEVKPQLDEGVKSGPLFIQIDKFEDALESFAHIKRKVNDISDMLRDIRELRNREEAELREWEREVETIKARLEDIDSEVFNKLE